MYERLEIRVVVDTNVLVSGIFWGGYPSRVLDMWAHDRFTLIVSLDILAEYSRVLKDLGERQSRTDLAGQWLNLLSHHASPIEVSTVVQECRDPHDDMYLACALDGAADFIVSGDKDLLTLKEFAGIPIVTPRRFIDRSFELSTQAPPSIEFWNSLLVWFRRIDCFSEAIRAA